MLGLALYSWPFYLYFAVKIVDFEPPRSVISLLCSVASREAEPAAVDTVASRSHAALMHG